MIDQLIKASTLLVLCVLTACSSLNNLSQKKEGVSIKDDMPSESFVISLRNNIYTDICIAKSNWPDSRGRVSESQNIKIVVGKNVFDQLDLGQNDCFDFANEGICSHRVSPGEILIARIPYANFQLPDQLKDRHKILLYNPPYYASESQCRPAE